MIRITPLTIAKAKVRGVFFLVTYPKKNNKKKDLLHKNEKHIFAVSKF
jgi:hypothetical protein